MNGGPPPLVARDFCLQHHLQVAPDGLVFGKASQVLELLLLAAVQEARDVLLQSARVEAAATSCLSCSPGMLLLLPAVPAGPPA
jgi:hypothetical protein